MIFDTTLKAQVLVEAINSGEPNDYIKSLFIALSESVSNGGDALAAEHMEELRNMVSVYNAFMQGREYE